MKKGKTIKASKQELQSYRNEIDKLRDKSAHLTDEAKKQFEKGAKELEKLYAKADKQYDELLEKAKGEWKDVKGFVELTDKALQHSFNYFMSHYRKKTK